MGRRQKKRDKEAMGQAMRMSAIGIEFSISVVGGLLLGWWLDKRWGTNPYFTLGGLVLGSTAGFWALYRVVIASQDDS